MGEQSVVDILSIMIAYSVWPLSMKIFSFSLCYHGTYIVVVTYEMGEFYLMYILNLGEIFDMHLSIYLTDCVKKT